MTGQSKTNGWWWNEAREMRANGYKLREIAAEFDVSEAMVSRAVSHDRAPLPVGFKKGEGGGKKGTRQSFQGKATFVAASPRLAITFDEATHAAVNELAATLNMSVSSTAVMLINAGLKATTRC